MKLSKQHREALVYELRVAIGERKEIVELILKHTKENDGFKKWREVTLFLANEKVKLIEKSLIDGEIDFPSNKR